MQRYVLIGTIRHFAVFYSWRLGKTCEWDDKSVRSIQQSIYTSRQLKGWDLVDMRPFCSLCKQLSSLTHVGQLVFNNSCCMSLPWLCSSCLPIISMLKVNVTQLWHKTSLSTDYRTMCLINTNKWLSPNYCNRFPTEWLTTDGEATQTMTSSSF